MLIALCVSLFLATLAVYAREGLRTQTSVYDIEADRYGLDTAPELQYIQGTGIRLAYMGRDGYLSRGMTTSPWMRTPYPANDIILSWNIDLPLGTGAVIETRVDSLDGTKTSSWYEMARIGKLPVLPCPIKSDASGHVDADTLMLNGHFDQHQYRVTLFSAVPHHTPTLRLIAVCATDRETKTPYTSYEKTSHDKPWMRSLDVRWRSQMIEDESIARRICGPTSLSQALEFWECKVPTPDVAAEAFDETNRIFGNWPFLAQVAASHGIKAWVMRCQDFTPIENELAAGHPVILSLRYGKGELSNAPLESTDGHLVLCVGANSDGDFLVNDSASTDPAFSHRVYKRDELAVAWLKIGGVIICLEPRNRA